MAMKTPEINASSNADIAFLLLAFFLATTTMNVDSGLFRRLPPYMENAEAPKVAKRNILQVLVNRNDQLSINGELADVSTVKQRTIEFILNTNNSQDKPSKKIVEIPLIGNAEVSNGIVSLQSDKSTSYAMYIAVQDQLTAAFHEMRNKRSNIQWGKDYDDLTDEQRTAINKVIPMNVSEAEPKNIKK